MKLPLTVLVIASLMVVFGPAGRAEACSCAMLDPAAMLEDSDAAFVGTLKERPTTPNSPDGFSGIWLFEADEWVKGDLGAQVGVHSSLDGASCGFELEEGQQVGIFLYNDNGRPSGGLCSVTTAEAMRAAAKPLVFDGAGPPVFLIGNDSGRSRFALLDGKGRMLAAVADDRNGWSVSVCPGNKNFVDVVEGEVSVRNAATLDLVRSVDPPERGRPEQVWCLDETGVKILAQVWDENGTEPSLMILETDIVVSDSAGYLMSVSGRKLAVVANPNAHSITLTDLETGERSHVDTNAQIGNIALSPDGQTLLVVESTNGPDGSHGSVMNAYDLADNTLTWTSDYLPFGEFAGWIDGHRLVALTYPQNGGEPTSIIFDIDANTATEAALQGWQFAAAGDTIVSTGNGVLYVADEEGFSVELAAMPTPTHRLIAVLDQNVDLTIPSPTSLPTAAPGGSQPAPTQPPDATLPALTTAAALVGVALIGAAGTLAWRRRNR